MAQARQRNAEEQVMNIKPGMKVLITDTAPVSRQFVGRTVLVKRVLGNAVNVDFEGRGAFLHLTWGTKRNPGNLGFTVVA
jgi:hypothetical protein